jgi:hypothetical protein
MRAQALERARIHQNNQQKQWIRLLVMFKMLCLSMLLLKSKRNEQLAYLMHNSHTLGTKSTFASFFIKRDTVTSV